jgi:cell division protein FtsX
LNVRESGFDPNNPNFEMTGRLRTGVDLAEAEVEAQTIIAAASPFPPELRATVGVQGVRIINRQDQETTLARTPAILAFAGALILLLIGCCNVANLLLGESAKREYEMAMRSALGADAGRIIRQLTTEGLLLSLFGGLLGAAMSIAFVRGVSDQALSRPR